MSWRNTLSRTMIELIVNVHSTAKASEGLRKFVRNNYAELKTLNPTLDILIRESSEADAAFHAIYEWNVQQNIPLDNLDEDQITEKLHFLSKLGGIMPPSMALTAIVPEPIKDGLAEEWLEDLDPDRRFRKPSRFEKLAWNDMAVDPQWNDFTPEGLQKYVDKFIPRHIQEQERAREEAEMQSLTEELEKEGWFARRKKNRLGLPEQKVE